MESDHRFFFISLPPLLPNFFLSLLDLSISCGRGASSGNMLTMSACAKGRGTRAGSARDMLLYGDSDRLSLRSTSWNRAGSLLVRRSPFCFVSAVGSGPAATAGGVMVNSGPGRLTQLSWNSDWVVAGAEVNALVETGLPLESV